MNTFLITGPYDRKMTSLRGAVKTSTWLYRQYMKYLKEWALMGSEEGFLEGTMPWAMVYWDQKAGDGGWVTVCVGGMAVCL